MSDLTSYAVAHEGRSRSYALTSSILDTQFFVLALHPLTRGSGYAFTNTRLLREAGFALIAPLGIEHSWNGDGGCCGVARAENIDDLGFIRVVIQDIENRHRISLKNKVLVLGWSNGGFLVSRLAKDAARGVPGTEFVAALATHVSYFRNIDPILTTTTTKQALPFFSMIGALDHNVNSTHGCCQTTVPACCCGIDESACRTAHEGFLQWSGIVNKDVKSRKEGYPHLKRVEASDNAFACWGRGSTPRTSASYCVARDQGHVWSDPSSMEMFENLVADFACSVLWDGETSSGKESLCKDRPSLKSWVKPTKSPTLPGAPTKGPTFQNFVIGKSSVSSPLLSQIVSFSTGFFAVLLLVVCCRNFCRKREKSAKYSKIEAASAASSGNAADIPSVT